MNAWIIINLISVAPILSYKIVETLGETGYVIEDGPYGGGGGNPWTDGGESHLHGDISGIQLRSGDKVDSIKVMYGDVWGENHGGASGSLDTLVLNPGAKITIVQGRAGNGLDGLEMITNDGMVFGPFGGDGGDTFLSIHPGCYLAYLSGSARDGLDSITLHWQCL